MQALLAAPRDGLVEADVKEALSLQRGGQFRHGVDVLDRYDQPTGDQQPFTSASVDWNYRPPDLTSGQENAVAAVLRQGSLELVGAPSVDLASRRFQLWTEMRLRTGGWARWPLGVFVATNPTVSDDGLTVRRVLSLADKSWLWFIATLTDAVHVPATAVAVDYVKADLTSRFGETRFAFAASSATVGGNGLVIEAGTSWLELYSRVLASVGFDQLTADESGAPASQSLATLAGKGAEMIYGAGQGKVLTAGSIEPLLPNMPNVVRFTSRQGPSSHGTEGNGIYTARNASTGPASIAQRGYEVPITVQVDAYDQATLVAVGDAEKQRYFAGGGLRWSGQVGLNPRHSHRDVIALGLPRLGLNSDSSWLVTSWHYPLLPMTQDSAALMTLTAERRVP